MRKSLTLLAIALIAAAAPSLAQTTATTMSSTAGNIPETAKPARDNIMIQLTYEGWSKVPDTVKVGGFGRGFNAYLMYDFPIKKSNFSFAAGIGIGTSNIYFKDQQLSFTDTGALGKGVRFLPESLDYKKYKLTMAYLEAPFELRYFGNTLNRNKGFKAAIGLRVGTLIGAHTKDRRSVDGTRVVDKLSTKRFLESWRYAGTLRLGYGNFTLFGSYNLNTLFKEGNGPGVVPYSIGLCITGL